MVEKIKREKPQSIKQIDGMKTKDCSKYRNCLRITTLIFSYLYLAVVIPTTLFALQGVGKLDFQTVFPIIVLLLNHIAVILIIITLQGKKETSSNIFYFSIIVSVLIFSIFLMLLTNVLRGDAFITLPLLIPNFLYILYYVMSKKFKPKK